MKFILDFLTELYEDNKSYSTINSARSALSAIGLVYDGVSVGAHPIVIRFMKGIYNLRPPTSRYVHTWDVNIVLNKLRTYSPVKYTTLKVLSMKLAMLLCLVLAGRTQSVHLLTIRDIKKEPYAYILKYSDNLKQSRPGRNNQRAVIKAYPPDRRICPVTVLKEYLQRTAPIRKSDKLFISYVKPYDAVTKNTISRWLKTIMSCAGIDVFKYSTHSIRSASASKAKVCSVPIDDILSAVGWSSSRTFAKFYDKPVDCNRFQESVLS